MEKFEIWTVCNGGFMQTPAVRSLQYSKNPLVWLLYPADTVDKHISE